MADLVSFPSLSGTPNGAIVGYIKDYFENLGIPVTLSMRMMMAKDLIYLPRLVRKLTGAFCCPDTVTWCRRMAPDGAADPFTFCIRKGWPTLWARCGGYERVFGDGDGDGASSLKMLKMRDADAACITLLPLMKKLAVLGRHKCPHFCRNSRR